MHLAILSNVALQPDSSFKRRAPEMTPEQMTWIANALWVAFDLRSHTIDLNSIAVLVAIILVFVGRRMRKQLLPVGFGLLILWLYIGVVSSVV